MPRKQHIQERVTRAEFARRKNVSRMAVTKAVQSGRISTDSDGKIPLEQALKDWDANADIGQRRNGKNEDWQAARTRREIAEANLAELELQEKQGSLVSVEAVQKELAAMVTITRDRILGVPRRVAPIVMGKQDENEVADEIYHELENALKSLAQKDF